jgi:mannose-6-phosphate isomerase-like protein (cupin superfamily)
MAWKFYRHIKQVENIFEENEVFKVVEGTIAFQEGTEIVVAHPGDSIFLSQENFHLWRNIGNEPARMLLLTTPSEFEETIREGGELPVTDSLQPPVIDPTKF